MPRPIWQLPRGVPRGLWEYTRSEQIADDYDDYFAFTQLFEFDEAVLAANFDPPGLVADLGCGTGRALVPLCRRGASGLAVDLSPHMLRIVQQKADLEGLDIDCLHANLVELDCLKDECIDHAMCMFSTLGMIQGRASRQQFLEHVCRVLKPGGRFVLHVHNLWYNLFDYSGRPWLVRHMLRLAAGRLTRRRDVELGDKQYAYRGIPNMELHVFTKHQLKQALRAAGLQIREFIPLDTQRQKRLRLGWLLPRVRANGWIVVCQRPG